MISFTLISEINKIKINLLTTVYNQKGLLKHLSNKAAFIHFLHVKEPEEEHDFFFPTRLTTAFPPSFDLIHIGQTVGRAPASGAALSLHHIELDPSAVYVVATQVLIDMGGWTQTVHRNTVFCYFIRIPSINL